MSINVKLSFFEQCKQLQVGMKLSVLETKDKKLEFVIIVNQYYNAKQMEVSERKGNSTHIINYSDVTKLII